MKERTYGPFSYSPIIDRPPLKWPNDAQLAVWVVPNIEFFPLNENVFFGTGFSPDVMNWSNRDYGARVGVFRIMEVLDKYGIRGTVALNSDVCDVYPQIIDAGKERGWEFMGHNQSNSRPLNQVPAEEERDVILATFDRIEKAVGRRPRGWLSGGLIETWNTLDYLIDAGGDYVCDWINDDQPYEMDVDGKRLFSIPYSGETNDFGAFWRFGRTPEEFDSMLRRQFDVLYREGARSGRVMAICLHPFIIGVPYRIDALDSALDYICGHENIWLATGSEIIDAYAEATASG